MRKIALSLSMAALLVACGGENNQSGDKKQKSTEQEDQKKQENSDQNNKQQSNSGGKEESVKTTTVSFDRTTHDFGDIPAGEKVKTTFTFTNKGDSPLNIRDAQGSCGCTVPEYPEAPVPPGEKEEIKVEFDSNGKSGEIKKSVSITANTKPATSKLIIKGKIKK